MIRNIVFDVGNVLVEFRWYEYMLDLGIDEEAAGFLGENMVLTDFWNRMDLGIQEEDEAPDIFCAKYPQYEREIRLFWKDTLQMVREYDYSLPLFKELKAGGYGVYLLSNYPPKLSGVHWPGFKFRAYADGEIISGIEKVAKPDPAIYKLLFDRYCLKPEECLFVDDRDVNVEAAKNLGMKAFLFEAREGRPAIDRLKELIESIEQENARELASKAQEARKNAYCPYSHYAVGAAVLTQDRQVFTGVNIENASYPAGICAERSAISAAVSSGAVKIRAVAVAGGREGHECSGAMPCGICRQVLSEFAAPEGMDVYVVREGGTHRYSLDELLPHSFGPDEVKQ